MPTPTDNAPSVLCQGTLVPAADTVMYQAPAAPGVGVRITQIMVTNVSGVAVTLYLHKTPNVVAANRYCILGSPAAGAPVGVTIPGDGWPVTIPLTSGLILNPQDMIRAQASAANALAMFIDGIVMNP